MNKTKLPYYEIFSLLIGEVILSALISVGYLIAGKFDYTVITGAALGSLVTVLNFLYLAITTTKAINEFLELRGAIEMTEEESTAFAVEHQIKIQNAMKVSYIIRTVTMLLCLVLAFLLNVFSVIATLIPLVAYRPITMVAALIKRKVIKNEF